MPVVSSFFVESIENIKIVPTRISKHLKVSRLVAEFGSFWGNTVYSYETTFTHSTYGRFLEKYVMKHIIMEFVILLFSYDCFLFLKLINSIKKFSTIMVS